MEVCDYYVSLIEWRCIRSGVECKIKPSESVDAGHMEAVMKNRILIQRLVFILFSLCCASCGLQITDGTGSLKVVYFVHGQGELSAADLQSHPEVVVAK